MVGYREIRALGQKLETFERMRKYANSNPEFLFDEAAEVLAIVEPHFDSLDLRIDPTWRSALAAIRSVHGMTDDEAFRQHAGRAMRVAMVRLVESMIEDDALPTIAEADDEDDEPCPATQAPVPVVMATAGDDELAAGIVQALSAGETGAFPAHVAAE